MTQKYYQQHKEEIQQRSREWYYNHKEENKQYKNEWRKNNKQKYNQIQRRYRKKSYQKHKERIAAENKRAYQKRRMVVLQEKRKVFDEMAQQYEHVSICNNEFEVFENGMVWNWNEYIFMKLQLNKQGYHYIRIHQKHNLINRLVATAFDDRDEVMLKDMHCHHCDITPLNDSISNLVFLPQNVHLTMHKHLDEETIKAIGAQVKHLRGTAKTNQFIRLVKKEFKQLFNFL